jgi:hypothetical protein
MVNDAGCHSFDVLMSKTRQQNDSQHLLNPLNHYNERTYCRLKSKLRKQLRKKTSDAASPKSVKSRKIDQNPLEWQMGVQKALAHAILIRVDGCC